MKLVMEIKEKEQQIEHLELKNKEIGVDLHICQRRSEGLEGEIDRLRKQEREIEEKYEKGQQELDKLYLENQNLRNQNEEKMVNLGK